MARSLRIQYAGAYYHVMARGNRREPIVLDDDDRRFFLKALGEACGMTGWRVHAWVLMTNHYHLFIETPGPNLVHGMGWLQNTVTRRHNLRHGLWGRMFGDPAGLVLGRAGFSGEAGDAQCGERQPATPAREEGRAGEAAIEADEGFPEERATQSLMAM